MAKIYGNTTTTPLNPDMFGGADQTYNPESENAQSGKAVAEAISNRPTVYSGTQIFIYVEDESFPEIIWGTFKPMGNTKWTTPYNVGDLYYNTEHKQLCVCVETNEDNSHFSSTWRLANMLPEHVYNPKSGLAQSGMAVAEAVAPKADKSYLDNTFANSLKGSKSGNVIAINDVSPVKHNLNINLTSDTIADFSNVKVSIYGKNLFDVTNLNWIGGQSFTNNLTENSITIIQKGASAYQLSFFELPTELSGKKVTVSTKYKTSGKNKGAFSGCVVKTGTNTIIQSITGHIGISSPDNFTDGVFTNTFPKLNEGESLALVFYSNCGGSGLENGVEYTTTYKDIQIELNDTKTEYEPYIEPQTVTANADGRLDGITSISPNITLVTDTDDAIISVNYNADTKKYIDNKFAELSQALLNL